MNVFILRRKVSNNNNNLQNDWKKTHMLARIKMSTQFKDSYMFSTQFKDRKTLWPRNSNYIKIIFIHIFYSRILFFWRTDDFKGLYYSLIENNFNVV